MEQSDFIRVGSFRQLKKDIRGSEAHLIIGIDVAKDKHHAFFGTAQGRTLLRRLVFTNTAEGFERLLSTARSLALAEGLDKTVFGLEPTANYHKPLGQFLIRRGHEVVLVSGVAVRRNRELLDGRWDKNDTKDAANVADLISQGKVLFYADSSRELGELQSLILLKIKLKKLEHGFKVRIRNHLVAVYFPELDPYCGQGTAESLAIVRHVLDPSRIAKMDAEAFRLKVTDRDRGLKQRQRLESIRNLAQASIGCEFLEAAGFEARIMVDCLEHIRRHLRATEARMATIAQGFPAYQRLMSIPGFGPDVSSKVLAAIGDPERFDNHRQVLKMAGLDLNAARSGKASDTAVPVISKRGKPYLRYALYQAALVASTRNLLFMEWFANRLRGREKERGIKTKMRVKLAAKMLVIAWTLMKHDEPFNPAWLTL